MHAVIYGKQLPVAFKILSFEKRKGEWGFIIENGGSCPQSCWVLIRKGLQVKPIADIEPEVFIPNNERKGGHNTTLAGRKRKYFKKYVPFCYMCGEAMLVKPHVCRERRVDGGSDMFKPGHLLGYDNG